MFDTKQLISRILVVLIFFSFSTNYTWAGQEKDLSPLALKTMEIVDAAYAFILEHSEDMAAVQQALQNDPRFMDHDRGLYIFVHCYNEAKKEAICCAQGIRPELIGKNMWQLRTPSGRLLFHELINIVERNGGGWLEYEWLNPFTNKIQTKCSYVRAIVLKDGRKAWVGSGYWKK